MKRILTSRWMQLVAALFLLAVLVAGYTWFADHLPPRPQRVLQLDDTPMETPIFSPDGKLLLTIHSVAGPDPFEKCELVLWDLATCKRRWSTVVDRINCLNHPGVEFSPDSRLLAAKSKGYDLKIWDTSTGNLRLKKVLDHCREDNGGFSYDYFARTRFSPDGRYLLIEKRSQAIFGQVIFWDLATDQEWTRIDGAFGSLRFTPNGKRFAILDGGPDRAVQVRLDNVALWEILEGDSLPRLLRRQQIVLGKSGFPRAFVFSSDLRTCAFEDVDQVDEIQLEDLSTNGDIASIMHRHSENGGVHFDSGKGASCLEFSPNGHFLMATLEGGEIFHGTRVVSYLKHVTWKVPGEVQAVHVLKSVPLVSPCGRWVLFPDTDGADVWEVGAQRKLVDLRRQTDHDPGSGRSGIGGLGSGILPAAKYQFSSDGQFVMVTGFQTTTTPNLTEMVVTGQWSRINKPETVRVGRLWDVERGENIVTFYGCKEALFSPDGHTLATLDDSNTNSEKTILFWSVPPRRPVGLILALTTATWALTLLLCWAVKRRLRRRILTVARRFP